MLAALGGLGLLLVLVGIIRGFIPVDVGVSCGSAFRPNNNANIADLTDVMTGFGSLHYTDQCASALSGARTVAIMFLVPGVILTLVGLAPLFERIKTPAPVPTDQ